ncbi:hypothetical protein Tco_0891220 [Tanacetum coccineum]|uniref:Uncharacterized protein n=1 Tax=Tanacetum coccineum TaxID=301880 RepID=A0ABQ5C5I4_9ASTR
MASPGLDGSVRKNIEDECPIIDEVLIDVPVVNEAHEAVVDEAVVHEGPVDDMGNDKGIVIEENVNPAMYDQSETDSDNEQKVNDDMFNYHMYVDDSDSEYLDKSFHYLSECEDEVRELRKRNFDAKRAPNSPKQNIDNVGTSKPKRVHDFGDSETVIEHEEFMDDLMRKLKRLLKRVIDKEEGLLKIECSEIEGIVRINLIERRRDKVINDVGNVKRVIDKGKGIMIDDVRA